MEHILLPNIPRICAAFSEWCSCWLILIKLISIKKQHAWQWLLGLGLIGQLLLQVWAGQFWFLGMLINFCWMTAVLWACEQRPAWYSLIYQSCKAFVAAELMASFIWQPVCYLGWYLKSSMTQLTLMGLVGLAIAFGLLDWLVDSQKFSDICRNVDKNFAIITAIIAIMAFSISNIGFWLENTPFTLGSTLTLFTIRTLIDLGGLTIITIMENERYERILKKDLDAMNNMVNLQYAEYQAYRESSELVNQRFHDLKHQLDVIAMTANEEQRLQYIHSLQNDIQQFKADVKTGNPIVDVILTRKNAYCIKHQINFSCIADGQLLHFIDTMDLCSLLGNTLDNAIESVSKLDDPQQRIIRLRITQKNQFIVYSITNFFEEAPNFLGELPQTTKKDDQHPHGYGLKSTKRIAQKYGGTMAINTDGHWFTLSIVFNQKTASI